MPRQLRIDYPGAIHHVLSRGDRGEEIYEEDVDRQEFLKTLAEACQKADWQVRAYCLMGSHFHLVVETPKGNLVEGSHWPWFGSFSAQLSGRETPAPEHRARRLGARPAIDAPPAVSYGCARFMNWKLLAKTLFVIVVLLLLVLMGMHNREYITFTLPPLLTQQIRQPAALMFFGFFAVGVLTGTILTAGSKKGGSGKSSKGD